MNDLREKLKKITKEDYEAHKVDLHIHTLCSDGEGRWEDILASAKEQGYKLIAITDHNTAEVHTHVKDDILLSGVEFDCWFGYVFIHLLAYGIDVKNTDFRKFLAHSPRGTRHVLPRLFSFRNVPKLIQAIHSAGGIAVLAHPACYWALSLDRLVRNLMKYGLDGIETYYPYPRFRRFVKFHSANDVIKIAEKYPQLIKTGGTDFHGTDF